MKTFQIDATVIDKQTKWWNCFFYLGTDVSVHNLLTFFVTLREVSFVWTQ